MRKKTSKTILITGVSSGIGRDAADSLCRAGHRVFGSIRKAEDAMDLQQKHPQNFQPLTFDVRDEAAVQNAFSSADFNRLDVLINNAGIAVGGPLALLESEALRRQFEVNLFALHSVIRTALPFLKASEDARIINVSSVSGLRSFPFVGPYSASKHALEAYSDALRVELKIYGIDVLLLEPGPIRSEIWSKTPDPDDNEYIGSDYEESLRQFYLNLKKSIDRALPVDATSQKILQLVSAKNPPVRNIVTSKKWLNLWLPRLLPSRFTDKLYGKALKLLKR